MTRLAIVLMLGMAAWGQEMSEAEINDIILRFAAKEAEFAKARENYTYRQRYRIEELDMSGRTVG